MYFLCMAAGPFVKIDRFLMKLGLPFSDQSSIWAHDLFSPHCDTHQSPTTMTTRYALARRR